MATSFQQQSLFRKLTYIFLIAILLTATLILRKMGHGIEAQAEQLSLREQNLGEVELMGSAVRLMLTGSRGYAICSLWLSAIEKQKKHEWNELELIVNSLTKLQPHFITPWLFQSWNLAYNVSVESDRVKDKYFYVAQGIGLLGEGERQNRDHPDLRFSMGLYYQNKIGISDENNTMRSLFQLSCMDPAEWDAAQFRASGETGGINIERFKEFCKRHPHLIRRLRETPGKKLDEVICKTPREVVDFLAASQKIPSRFEPRSKYSEDVTPLKAPYKRFPLLPPHSKFDPDEKTNDDEFDDVFDNFATGRAWFSYSQDPLEDGRKPRYITTIIFQGYPARAQAYVAERMEQEGWFDEGWTITDWFGKPLVVGEGRAMEAWNKAFEMYRQHGERNNLYKTPEALASMDGAALKDYEYNRSLTNFAHFYHKTDVEKMPPTVIARKYFYKADRLRRSGDRSLALEVYENPEAFGPPTTWDNPVSGWKRLLLDHPDFQRDNDVQEQSYEIERHYLSLARDLRGPRLKNALICLSFLHQPAARALVPPYFLPSPFVGARSMKVTIKGPLDGTNKDGQPLISKEAKTRVEGRH